QKGLLADDIFYKTKYKVAAAVDARMSGFNLAAMTSGGSGNQGILTILTSYMVGKEMKIAEPIIYESIAWAHILNAYTKCFLGELSVICGCAMSAGLSSATAIVYQQKGPDLQTMTLAVNNVIADLGGIICDGAKPGCALKAITSVDSAIRSAFMALDGLGPTLDDGIIGNSVEESIKNLSQVTLEGMLQVDPTLLKIFCSKGKTN
ncbi:MAG: L-serine ammonia-lyase, iron-sulfur-dependent, subunit alpha, partial [Bacteriovoracia bacterium]